MCRLWVQGSHCPCSEQRRDSCAEPHQPETHKPQSAEEKRKSHCDSLRASLSWKYSPPKEQGKHKGILCCVSLPASGQLWVLDTNSCHRSWDFSLQPSSSASLYKDHSWVCPTPFVYSTSPWSLQKKHDWKSWILRMLWKCHTCTVGDSKCHCSPTTPPARCDVKHYWE